MRVERITADLLGRAVQIGNDPVHREKAVDLAVQEDQAHDQEHHAVDDDIGKALALSRRKVQGDAKRDHRDIGDRQKPLIPFSVLHIFRSSNVCRSLPAEKLPAACGVRTCLLLRILL